MLACFRGPSCWRNRDARMRPSRRWSFDSPSFKSSSHRPIEGSSSNFTLPFFWFLSMIVLFFHFCRSSWPVCNASRVMWRRFRWTLLYLKPTTAMVASKSSSRTSHLSFHFLAGLCKIIFYVLSFAFLSRFKGRTPLTLLCVCVTGFFFSFVDFHNVKVMSSFPHILSSSHKLGVSYIPSFFITLVRNFQRSGSRLL